MKKYVIYGTGGFAREVACILKDRAEFDNFAFFVDVESVVEKLNGKRIFGKRVLTPDNIDVNIHKVIIGIGNSSIREKVVNELPDATEYPIIIDPTAVVSEWVKIGEGTIVCAGTIITCDIEIGKHCQFNLHSTVGHDCKIGDYFTSAPGAKLSGECVIGKHVYFGTLSAIRQGIKVVNNVVVGMGAMVVKDILESGVYIGAPAKKMNT